MVEGPHLFVGGDAVRHEPAVEAGQIRKQEQRHDAEEQDRKAASDQGGKATGISLGAALCHACSRGSIYRPERRRLEGGDEAAAVGDADQDAHAHQRDEEGVHHQAEHKGQEEAVVASPDAVGQVRTVCVNASKGSVGGSKPQTRGLGVGEPATMSALNDVLRSQPVRWS